MRLLILLLTLSVALSTSSVAWPAGPSAERWETIRTEHFRVHYHASVAPMAPEVARMCEAAHQTLAPFFQYEPWLVTDVVLVDGSEAANGSANAFPNPRITIYAVPPDSVDTRTDSDHWMWELILHEYVHILHLDHIKGWVRVVNFPFGRQFMPNQALPRWFTEGLATALESRETGGGRVRSNFYRMYLRAALLEGTMPTLGQLANNPPKFPYANNWYLMGGNFLYWIGETYGWETLQRATAEQARRLRPWALNWMALSAIGKTFDELWVEWQDDARAAAQAEAEALESEGLIEPELLTQGGFSSRWVASTPDGEETFWLVSDGEDEARFVSRRGPDDRRLRVRSSARFSLFPDGRSAVISLSRPWRSGYSRADLWRYDLKTGRTTRLTRGARAQSPAVAPGGEQIAFVAPKDGRLDLYLYEMRTGEIRPIVQASPWTTIGQPSWSPDGRFIAFSMSTIAQGRDLYIWEAATGTLRRLTDDRAIDDSPVFSPDGRWIYWSSDRSGIFDIYAAAFSAEGGDFQAKAKRVTRVRYGAISPMIGRDDSGCWLYLATYSERGFDIGRLPLSLDCGPGEGEVAAASYERPEIPLEFHPVEGTTRRYSALVRAHPWSWSPIYEQSGNYRQLGLSTGGTDPAGRLSWAANVSLGEPWNVVRWNAEVLWKGFLPDLRIRGGRSFYARPRSLRRASGWVPYEEVIDVYGLSTSFNVGAYRLSHGFTVGWLGEHRSMFRPVNTQHEPGSLLPITPILGNHSSLYFSWSASNLRSYTRSVSVERGWAMDATFRVRAPWTAADTRSRELSWGLTKAVPIHRWQRHAFVLRVRGAHMASSWASTRPYVLGGAWDQSILDALIEQTSAPTTVVRGYDSGVRSGANTLLLNAEYRFPLWWIDAGYSSMPLFFERLTGAVFVDAGSAYQRAPVLDELLLGVGAEVRLRFRLGYFLDQNMRLGVARGFGPDGIWNWYLSMGSGF